MRISPRAAAWIAVLIAGCTSPPEPAADAGPDCTPIGAGPERRCPEGCRAYEAHVIDRARGCTTRAARVVACFHGTAGFNGEPGCFERVDDPGERVATGSTEGIANGRDLFAGWQRCPMPDHYPPLPCD